MTTQKQIIATNQAPQAIGTYSQAVRVNDTVYLSGQIPLVAQTMEMVSDAIESQTEQVFSNLKAVAEAAGGNLGDCVKLTVYLTDLANFGTVNEVMATFFQQPYPARAAIGINALPRGALVEIDAIMVIPA